eukprot:GHUV01028644.1.p1 GENE.GHUV01028644.1~~GHUV01028644.1.p1  ORF type:complete len:103 (-),score=23.22 GHUV01028644.1:258-566(-)
MWHTQAQPDQEQRSHCYELHEEVAAVRQCCSQDVGKLVRCLYDAADLLEESTANSTLQEYIEHIPQVEDSSYAALQCTQAITAALGLQTTSTAEHNDRSAFI